MINGLLRPTFNVQLSLSAPIIGNTIITAIGDINITKLVSLCVNPNERNNGTITTPCNEYAKKIPQKLVVIATNFHSGNRISSLILRYSSLIVGVSEESKLSSSLMSL